MKKKPHRKFAPRSIASTVMLSLIGVIGFTGISSLKSQAAGYTYTKIAALGETAARGFQYIFDFEAGQINNRGDAIFVADLSTDGVTDIGEGVFLFSHGEISALALPGQPAPGGGTFSNFGFSPAGINDEGDGAFAILTVPPQPIATPAPLGTNAGLFRYSADTKSISAVVLPGVTVVPLDGKFQGVHFATSINNRGDICFTGLIQTTFGLPNQDVGMGIFVADKAGHIRKVVIPGDSAPGGGRFDFAEIAWINDRGDVGFGANIAGETSEGDNSYLSKAPSGQIISIAHQGDAAPGGGTFRVPWGPIVNNDHRVLFVGDLSSTPAPPLSSQGLFLFNGSFTVPVIRPGDALPDGTLVTVSFFC
jgi:hypothetical protein